MNFKWQTKGSDLLTIEVRVTSESRTRFRVNDLRTPVSVSVGVLLLQPTYNVGLSCNLRKTWLEGNDCLFDSRSRKPFLDSDTRILCRSGRVNPTTVGTLV